jgi:hypothetical protein
MSYVNQREHVMKKKTTKEIDGIEILDDIQLEKVSGGRKRKIPPGLKRKKRK